MVLMQTYPTVTAARPLRRTPSPGKEGASSVSSWRAGVASRATPLELGALKRVRCTRMRRARTVRPSRGQPHKRLVAAVHPTADMVEHISPHATPAGTFITPRATQADTQ